jgi:hypothetical protein
MGVSLHELISPRKTVLLKPSKALLEPVEGFLGPGLFAFGYPPELVHQRNILIEQLASSVALGEDFLGIPTNQCGVLLASTEPEEVQRRGIIPAGGVTWRGKLWCAGVTLRPCSTGGPPVSWPERIPASDDLDAIEKWKGEWLAGDHHLIILGTWSHVLPWPKEWVRQYLGYDPGVDEKGRNIALGNMEIATVSQLNAWAREKGVTIVVFQELVDKQTRLARTVGLHNAYQIWLKRGHKLEVPDRKRYGAARTIPLKCDDSGLFSVRVDEVDDHQKKAKRKKGDNTEQPNATDQAILAYLDEKGDCTLRQIVDGTGLKKGTVDSRLTRWLVPDKVSKNQKDHPHSYTLNRSQ